MNNVLEHVTAFWMAYGPWIGASLIPTIIAGLTVSPKTAGGGPIVQKVWDILKTVMGWLSVLTHKDEPGTFQVPLLKAVKSAKGKDAGPVVALVATLGILSSSCAWWSKHGEKVTDTVVNCSVVAVRDAATDLLPAVLAILSGGSVKWTDQINAFVHKFGQDAVACALEMASAQTLASVQYGDGSDGSGVSMDVVNKSRQYLDDNHITIQGQ